LIQALLAQNKPLFGVCFGAQQITKTLGYPVTKAPAKEVGWAPVYRQATTVRGIPLKADVLHWHEEMFEIPAHADLLFSSDRVRNQGFVLNHRVIGLQFHLEPRRNNVREMMVNDYPYLIGSVIHQTAQEIVDHPIPRQNRRMLFQLLDYINS
jgi:GMP synthase - Glutamine amidotransferase domain